jgi:hypothetical protein
MRKHCIFLLWLARLGQVQMPVNMDGVAAKLIVYMIIKVRKIPKDLWY